MLCQRWGHQLLTNARFCPECGTPVLPAAAPARRSRAPFWIAGLGCFALLGLGAVGTLFVPALLAESGYELDLPFGGGSEGPTGTAGGSQFLREGKSGASAAIGNAPASGTTPRALSADQELVKASFGRPPAFRVAFGADPVSGKPVRVETWLYPKQAASFVFRDGKYADSPDIPLESSPVKPDTARPEQFAEAVTLADVIKSSGEPLFQIDVKAKDGVLTAFHFANGLVAGFGRDDGKLRFIEQLARRSSP
jgi:hypothetical protein